MLFDIRFVGIQAGEGAPAVALYLLDASGQAQRKLAVSKDGKLDVDPALAKETIAALGPDVQDLAQLEPNALMQFRPPERVPVWQDKKIIEIPRDWWLRWRFFVVCLNGRVRKCLRLLLDLAEPSFTLPFPKPKFPFPPPVICWPICNGVVEIYERTCCCRPPILVDLPKILEKLKVALPPIIKWPPPPPPPDSVRLEPDPAPDPIAVRTIKRAQAYGEMDPIAPPNQQLRNDVETLQNLQPAAALQYIIDRPYLAPIWCRCSTRKVGETVLNPDGRFHFCYTKFPYPSIFCRSLYYFKVRQWQDTQWVYIYDGSASHQYFSASDFAEIQTFLGRACGQAPPPPGGPKPFAMLQDIGSTHSFSLVSHYMGKNMAGVDLTQTGQFSVANPVPNGGLVNAPYNAPWGEVLSFRLYFHPGLKALGAVYYRVSVVAADAHGNPAGGAAPQPITNSIAWLKFVVSGSHFVVESENLGPNTKIVGGNPVTGLFKIPYDGDAFWLGGQYHQHLDTRLSANGRYLVVLEIFDTNGVRLRPAGTADAGTDTNFDFLRWLVETGPDSTATVPFAALTHLFWIDNRPCYADIEDLKRNHVSNTQECQFLTGPAATLFSVGFRSFHAATGDPIPPPQTFMDSFALWYHRGLNGPTVTFQTGNTNQPASLLAGPNAESVALTFAAMLGTATPGAKCTFAVNLGVYAKHTNGSRRLSEYDRYDQAAFALEITA